MSIQQLSRLWTRSECGTRHHHLLLATTHRPHPVTNLRSFSLSRSTVQTNDTPEKQRLATIRLYRILQRTCRSFPTQNTAMDAPTVLLQHPLKANDWGRHMIFKPSSSTMVEELFRLFFLLNDEPDGGVDMEKTSSVDDWYDIMTERYMAERDLPPLTSLTCWTTSGQMQEAIRTAFRTSFDAKIDNLSNLHFWAIRAVQFMHEQQLLWKNSSVATTNGVRVTATSRCIGSTSPTAVSSVPPSGMSILETKFRFAYRIRVENVSNESVQLLGRYWCIEELTASGKEDDTKEKIVVDSPATGAVGHLPVLRPGQVFEYMSGTDLVGTKGIMKGHFYMVRVPDDRLPAKAGDHVEGLSADDKFEVEVASFPLEANVAM